MNKYISGNISLKTKPGFTLVEMLVAVGLLLLLMSILAQMFALASDAVTKTKGIANNDQKSRILFTIIDNDLNKISYRAVESQKGNGIHPVFTFGSYDNHQKGYFYVSENDPDNDSDDVLSFTAEAESTLARNRDNTPFYGRAILFGSSANYDQPDWDDAGQGNGATLSRHAEITYFLRHGTLYRQVFLVREALQPLEANVLLDDIADPETTAGTLITGYSGTSFTGNGNFYNDFNLSGFYDSSDAIPRLKLHGTLLNTSTSFPLGDPHFRTGFYHADGLPMEYWKDSTNKRHFIGRFTMREMSDPDFDYPLTPVTSSPITPPKTKVYLTEGHNLTTFENKGVLDKFDTVSAINPTTGNFNKRTGTDILMNNVLGFDVKLWDDALGRFADVGHDDAVGDFNINNRDNDAYGPFGSAGTATSGPLANRVYDTWGRNVTGIGTNMAPFQLLINKTASAPWTPLAPHSVGDIYFPGVTVNNGHLYFQVVQAGNAGLTEPNWQSFSLNSVITDGTVIWQPRLNMKALKGLKVTVRFKDTFSGQVRQTSIIHSFTE